MYRSGHHLNLVQVLLQKLVLGCNKGWGKNLKGSRGRNWATVRLAKIVAEKGGGAGAEKSIVAKKNWAEVEVGDGDTRKESVMKTGLMTSLFKD